MGDLDEIRKEIAYRRWQLTGCDDKDLNWREAEKILLHFLKRRTESYYWQREDEDYRPLYGDLIGGENEPDTDKFTPRPPKDCGNN